MISNKSGRLGDLSEYRIKIAGEDVTNAVAMCNIWQDVFTPTWSAAIALSDTNNMIHTIPIAQGTEVEITMATKQNSPLDGNKVFKFVVFKITDRQLEKSMHQSYTLNLVHKDLIKNQQKRVQKHFSSTASGIVSQVISKEIGGSVEADSSDASINAMVCNWSPFVTANWCAMHAVSSGAADYVFFMSDDQRYKFKSLEKMYKDELEFKLTQRLADVKDDGAKTPQDRFTSYTQFRFEHGDAIANLAGGLYGSEVNSYDFVKKIWEKKSFKYGEDVGDDASKKSFKDDVFSDSKLTSTAWAPKHKKMFEGGSNIYDKVEKWSGSRKSSLMKLEQDRLFLQLPGGIKTWEWLGKSIEVELPSHEDMSGEDHDKYYKGKYLIIAVSHQVVGHIYNVTLELIKKRVERDMNGQ